MRRMVAIQNGRATKNHSPQLGCGDIFWRAMIFCGEAMGDAAPPILEASAMPRIRAFENRESDGRLRSKGWV